MRREWREGSTSEQRGISSTLERIWGCREEGERKGRAAPAGWHSAWKGMMRVRVCCAVDPSEWSWQERSEAGMLHKCLEELGHTLEISPLLSEF